METTENPNTQAVAPDPLPMEVRVILDALNEIKNQQHIIVPVQFLATLERDLKRAMKEIERLSEIKEPKLSLRFQVTSRRNSTFEESGGGMFDVTWPEYVPDKLKYGYTKVTVEQIPEAEEYKWLYDQILEQVKILRTGEDNIRAMTNGLRKAWQRVNEQIDKQPWYLRWLYRKWALPPDENQGNA